MWEGLQQEVPTQCPPEGSHGGKALRLQLACSVEKPEPFQWGDRPHKGTEGTWKCGGDTIHQIKTQVKTGSPKNSLIPKVRYAAQLKRTSSCK